MRFYQFIYRYRWPVVIATFLLTLFFSWPLCQLKINADLTSYLPKSDPAVRTMEYIADTYGGNFVAVIALESDDIFKPHILESIRELTSRLQLLDGVNYVTSLTNILDLKKGEEGLEIGRLLSEEDFPVSQARAQELRAYVLQKKRFRGRLVSEDGRVTLIVVAIRKDVEKNKIMAEIEKTVKAASLPGEVRLAGLPAQLREISRFIVSDLKTLTPLVAVVIFLCLFLSFRSFRGVFIPLLAVIVSTIWTLGLMGLLGIPLTIISDAIPVLLLAVGSAYSLHLLKRFDEAPEEQKVKALAHISTSVLLAALTTMAGFMSFIFGSYLSAIREFGMMASLGIFFALILSLTFVPALLFITASGRKRKGLASSGEFEGKDWGKRLEKWSFGFLRREKITLLIFLLVIALALAGIPRIERHSKMLDYFEASSEIRRSEDFLEKKIGGSIPISILVRGDIRDPEVLREMKAMEDFLEQHPLIHHPLSIADYLAEMNDLMGEGENIPDSREKVSNLLFLLEGQEGLDQLLHPEKTEAVIQATIPSLDIGEMKHLVDQIENWIKERSFQKAQMVFSGSPLVYIHLDQSLIHSQVLSLILALVLIYLCVLFLVRSAAGALLGMIPIVFTLILIFGFMGYTGIPLDIVTVLVGSVSLGIGIDYALHWINRFRLEAGLMAREKISSREEMAGLNSGAGQPISLSPDSTSSYKRQEEKGEDSAPAGESLLDHFILIEAAERTLRSTGRAIFINMVTVAAGFLVLTFGHLIPLRRFGLLVALTMFSSGLGALTLLPAVIVRTKARWLRWNKKTGQRQAHNKI